MLRILGVSRSGYNAFRKRTPSAGQLKKKQRMAAIKTIYDESHKIYGAPKIAAKMRQKGDKVSERTVGKYMREIGIRACYRKHRTRTTRDCDFSSELKNILNRNFQPERPDAAWCTDITYIWTVEDFDRNCGLFTIYFIFYCSCNLFAVLCLFKNNVCHFCFILEGNACCLKIFYHW